MKTILKISPKHSISEHYTPNYRAVMHPFDYRMGYSEIRKDKPAFSTDRTEGNCFSNCFSGGYGWSFAFNCWDMY